MSAVCQNCKAKLSCGCQVARASDGRSVCNNCKSGYEAQLKNVNVPQTNQPRKT